MSKERQELAAVYIPWPLLHAEHARHGPGLDGAQVGVVDGELPAVTINTQLLNL